LSQFKKEDAKNKHARVQPAVTNHRTSQMNTQSKRREEAVVPVAPRREEARVCAPSGYRSPHRLHQYIRNTSAQHKHARVPPAVIDHLTACINIYTTQAHSTSTRACHQRLQITSPLASIYTQRKRSAEACTRAPRRASKAPGKRLCHHRWKKQNVR